MNTQSHDRPSIPGVLRSFLWGLALMVAAGAVACESQIPDQDIAEAIRGELELDPAVSAAEVRITAVQGVVTLDGTVGDLLTRERAERIAETVKGVRSVVNLMEVDPPEDLLDETIRQDVEWALLNDPAADAYEVTPEVKDGMVTLKGTVNSFAERELSEKVAMGVRGVEGIENDIVVEWDTERFDSEIGEEIEQALRWDVLVDHGLIDVQVVDGHVTLEGLVGSAAEKRQAEYDAWVAGVEEVDASDLDVGRWARDEDLRTDKYVEVPDDEIENAVELALIYDPRVLDRDVVVSSNAGVVTLEGVVSDLRAKRAAGEAARNTVGVALVENNLMVELEAPQADQEVARRIRDALERDPYLNPQEILVTVSGGVANLTGTVETSFEKAHADDVAARTLGVLEVNNNLEVQGAEGPIVYDPYVSRYDPGDLTWYEPQPMATQVPDHVIREAIEREFFWSPFVDGDDITVTVEDGRATLTGTVDSFLERRDATENAYEGGAVWVENELQVVADRPVIDSR